MKDHNHYLNNQNNVLSSNMDFGKLKIAENSRNNNNNSFTLKSFEEEKKLSDD